MWPFLALTPERRFAKVVIGAFLQGFIPFLDHVVYPGGAVAIDVIREHQACRVEPDGVANRELVAVSGDAPQVCDGDYKSLMCLGIDFDVSDPQLASLP